MKINEIKRKALQVSFFLIAALMFSFHSGISAAQENGQDIYNNEYNYDIPSGAQVQPMERFEIIRRKILNNESPLSHVYLAILGYAAVMTNDEQICKDSQICLDEFEDISRIKNLFNKNCKDVAANPLIKEWCQNFDNCDSISDPLLMSACQGFKSGNAQLAYNSMSEWDRKQGESDTLTSFEMSRYVSLYQGFLEQGGQRACEAVSMNTEHQGRHFYLCEVFFREAPVTQILDNVVEDLAYFLLSVETEDQAYCDYILNDDIRNGCLSPDPVNFFGAPESLATPDETYTVTRLSQ